MTLSGGTDALSGGVTVNGSSEIDNATIDGNGAHHHGGQWSDTDAGHGGALADVTLSGGTDALSGGVTVSGSSEIENATIDGNGPSTITVDSGQTLTLDMVTLARRDAVGRDRRPFRRGDGERLERDRERHVDGYGANTITVDSGQTLTLDMVTLDDVTLSGGTDALSGGVTVSGSSEIENATIDGYGNTSR